MTKENSSRFKLKIKEKIGYALGDTATNLAWRTLTTFLLVFYTDVYGLKPVDAGLLLLITRMTDGITDVIMGIIADRTNKKTGKFRPWILWTAVPFGLLMALTFTTPDFSYNGKLVYAYVTYILLTLAYTANNVPYSALMGVMTPDHKERTSLSSFRFAGAYFGGIITQGFLIYLVAFFGHGDENLGYRYSIYFFAALLIVFLLITYFTTKERIKPPKVENPDIKNDLKDLIKNKPWVIMLIVGFLFVVYNSIKQGITVIYFKRFIENETFAASYMIILLIASMGAALITTQMSDKIGKRNLFIAVLIFSGVANGFIWFLTPQNTTTLFVLGTLSEFGAGIMPVLFFSMLGDAADYSEWKTGRRATGLVYSAGTFAMKFGGGVAGAIIGFVLAGYGYDGMNTETIPNALPGIKLVMSWVPVIFTLIAAGILITYPLTKQKMTEISSDLEKSRK